MTPRTTSPSPTSYGPYDDFNDLDPNPSINPTSTTNNHHYSTALLTALLLQPLNLPRRVITSSTVQVISLVILYSFCITTLCFIFCASYVLTFYDDAKRIVRASRVWSQVKNGVREKLSMMGGDWEEFAKKYFEQTNLDGNATTNNNNSGNAKNGAEWEDWMKGMMFRFVAVIAGQENTNWFRQSAESFRFRHFSASNVNVNNNNSTNVNSPTA
ncbi:7972_t:CDS:2 [Ambispora gerdemannii]|uniref:7972_t:CDS:1 n=1 Tax=Ambispora gerdemannii TaxID=144530 RepID=A0A9N8V4S2_9GLOM|nr:7972_t:CDS:2 [Ambispora gerdemannii]